MFFRGWLAAPLAIAMCLTGKVEYAQGGEFSRTRRLRILCEVVQGPCAYSARLSKGLDIE